MARFETANTIINRVALEVGLATDTDPVSSTNEHFQQLQGLLDGCGQELVELHPWQGLMRPWEKVTAVPPDTGDYDLPDDFAYMINQTGWDQTNNVALGGPLGAQDWAYLEGRDLVSQSIYASFRLAQNKIRLFPQPPPNGLTIKFIYISRNWLLEQNGTTYRDTIGTGSDVVLYEPIMIMKFLKCKFLEAKGMDSSAARIEFENMLQARMGADEGAPILNAANNSRGFPYLHPYFNTGDTGFGT